MPEDCETMKYYESNFLKKLLKNTYFIIKKARLPFNL